MSLRSFLQRRPLGRLLNQTIIWFLMLAMSDANSRTLAGGPVLHGAILLLQRSRPFHEADPVLTQNLDSIFRRTSPRPGAPLASQANARVGEPSAERPPDYRETTSTKSSLFRGSIASKPSSEPVAELAKLTVPKDSPLPPAVALHSRASSLLFSDPGRPQGLQLAQIPLSTDPDPADVACFSLSARPKPGKVQLEWTAVVGAERYDIFRGAEADPVSFQKIGEAAPNLTLFLDSNLPNDVTYLYFVRALGGGTSCDSEPAAAHPTTRRGAPEYPPVILSHPVTRALEGTPYTYHLRAVDPYAVTALEYALVEGPAGMTVDPASGWVRWTSLPGFHLVTLTATDETGSTDTQSFLLEAQQRNHQPVANAGLDVPVHINNFVTLNGTGSHDPDGDALTYAWTLLDQPDGGAAVLNDSASPTPSLVPRVIGLYHFQLIVNDGVLDSDPDVVELRVVNRPPTAEVGDPKTVGLNSLVHLDGSGSSDPDGDPLTYLWAFEQFPPDSRAKLSSVTAVQPTFTSDRRGSYVLRLIVNDGHEDSTPDRITITTTNSIPIANASPDATAVMLATVTLDGSQSSDPDDDPLTYRWRVLSEPPGSAVALSDPTAPRPSFQIQRAGDITLELIVNDGFADSLPDTVVISTENSRPVAQAGENREAPSGTEVTLDGTGSSDADQDPLTYVWSVTSQPDPNAPVAFDDPSSATPKFLASLPGLYVFQLIVSDAKTNSEPDTVAITAVRQQVLVPDVVGRPQAQAESLIVNAALTVGTVTTAHHAVVPSGHVISQSPVAGTLVDPGSAVAMVVSLGPVLIAVPDVVGLSEAEADQKIARAKLTVGNLTLRHHPTVAAGLVISQNPVAGTLVTSGTPVNLELSLGPETTCAFSPAEFAQWAQRISPVGTGETPGTIRAAPAPDCALTLTEGDSFEVAAERIFTIPAGAGMLEILYDTPNFDGTSQGRMRDAFEVALVDGAGRPLTFTIQGQAGIPPADGTKPAPLPPSPDALFNHTDGQPPFVAAGSAWVSGAPNRLVIDVRSLAVGATPRLIVRLVNNDQDRHTEIRITEVRFAVFENSLDSSGSTGPAFPQDVEVGSVTGGNPRENDLPAGCNFAATGLPAPRPVPKIAAGPPDAPTLGITAPADRSSMQPGPAVLTGYAIAAHDQPNASPAEIIFGEDISPYSPGGENDVPRMNLDRSREAAASFASKLLDVRTEDMESFEVGSSPSALIFGSTIATVTGTRTIWEVADPSKTSSGAFPTSGKRVMVLYPGDQPAAGAVFFRLDFSAPQSAFGLLATDIEANQFELVFTAVDGTTRRELVPVTLPQGSGGGAFFGIIDRDKPFVSVEFKNVGSQPDGFGFDDLIIATPEQVLPKPTTNRITHVTINGVLTDANDAGDNFFARVQVHPGTNSFEVVATDAFHRSTTNAIEIFGTTCTENFASLSEVTSSIEPVYGRTSFNNWTQVLYAELALRNAAPEQVGSPLYVGVTRISDPEVKVLSPDGVSVEGVPFYDFSMAIPPAGLMAGQTSLSRTVAFSNPGHTQFSYELVILGRRNQSPTITTLPPLSILVNQSYTYDADATDLDADPLQFSLVSAPPSMSIASETGLISWSPGDVDLGNHDLRIRVEDGRGGVAEQNYILSVSAPPANRPPYFVSNPVTAAYPSVAITEAVESLDLGGWQIVQYDLSNRPGSQGPAQWTLSEANSVATQHRNADASILLSDIVLRNDRIEGTWKTLGDGDDDFMGFVFGYQDRGHYYLFDWKRGTQPDSSCGNSLAGMGVRVFHADSELSCADFWPAFAEPSRAQTLYRNQIAWQDQVEYRFVLETRQGSFVIEVFEGPTRLDRIEIFDDTYLDGRFGFYNYSQGQVIYRGFKRASLPAYSYTYDAVAVDPDRDPVTYTFSPSPTGPVGMSIDPRTGDIVWAPTLDQVGNHPVSITASDGHGGIAIQNFVVTVLGLPGNHAPTIVSEPTSRAFAGYPYEYPVVAVDPDADALHYALIESPAVMAIDETSGVIQWSAPVGAAGSFHVKVRVDDRKGGSDEQGFDILVARLGDLVVNQVDASALSYDAQCLTARGTVSATVSNLGLGTIDRPFEVLFFEDRNLNSSYDLGIDPVLGTANVVAALDAGSGIRVTAQVAGEVVFPGNVVWAWVDAKGEVPETNERNNLGRSGDDCRVEPLVGQFNPVIEWYKDRFSVRSESDQVMMTPAVADLDGNGIPEVVFTTFSGSGYGGNGVLRAVKGDTGQELWTVFNQDVHPGSQVAIGDIDGDGKPEIVAYLSNSSVAAFDHDGGFKWVSAIMPRSIVYGGPSIADLDGDGQPEVVVGNVVLNGSGILKWDGVAKGGTGNALGYSIVADLDLDGSAEVVTGNSAYRADGSVMWRTANSDGTVAIGDFDEDPFPEIVVVGGGQALMLEHDGKTKWGPITLPTRGGGAPTIADFDGDGRPEIGLAGEGLYVALRGDGSILWTRVTEDYSSWSTGSSVFDFDGDGQSEVVYGDEQKLWIFGGADGRTLYRLDSRGSGTLSEYPLVVDVDADGNAEIVVSANNYYRGNMKGIVVIGDAGDNWVSTRKIWNQHSYHINNINDDGTIPRHENPSWQTHNTYRLNALPTREAALAAPDLIPSALRVSATGGTGDVTARIGNGGAVLAPSALHVAFYDGDPSGTRRLLGTATTTKALVPGDYEDVRVALPLGSTTDLWCVVDDEGTGKGQVRECNEANNAYHPGVGLAPYNQPPTITSAPITAAREGEAYRYDVDASDAEGDALTFSLRVFPDGMRIEASSGLISWLPDSLATGPHPVEVVVTDSRGAWNCQLFVVTVADTLNSSPLITSEPTVTVNRGSLYKYVPHATDPDGDTLSYDLVTRPSGMVLDPPSGITVWRPDVSQVGRHDVVLRVRDGRGGVDVQAWQIEVGAGNSAPVITTTPPKPATTELPYQYEVQAQDAENDGIEITLDSGPTGLSIEKVPPPTQSPPGVAATTVSLVRWTPSASQIGDHTVVLVATDSRGAESLQTFTLPVVATALNDSPEITSSPRRSVRAGTPYVYFVTATDRNGDPLSFRLVKGPAGMALEATASALSQQLSWATAPNVIGTHRVEVEVSDGRGGQASQAFDLEVVPTGSNGAPLITSLPPPGAVVDRVYVYNPVGTDPDADPVIWSLVGGPSGVSVDASRGAVRWSPKSDQLGTNSVTIRATDPFGASGDQAFDIVVRSANQPPAIVSIPPTEASVAELYLYGVRANDPEGDPVTFKFSITPAGATLTPTGHPVPGTSTARMDWTPATSQAGFQTVIVEANDGNGGVASQSFTVLVTNEPKNRPPTITSNPILTARPEAPYRYDLTTADPEGDRVTFQLLKGPSGMALGTPATSLGAPLLWTPSAAQAGSHEVIVTATDASGAGARQRFTLTVRANQAPTITSTPALVVDAGTTYRYGIRATDPDGDRLRYTLAAGPAGMSVDNYGQILWSTDSKASGMQEVSVVVTDPYGASAMQSFDVVVQPDIQKPVVRVEALTGLVDDNGRKVYEINKAARFRVTASDNVGLATVRLQVGGQELTLDTSGYATTTLATPGFLDAVASAIDLAGNTASATETVRAVDQTASGNPEIVIESPAYDAVVMKQTPVVFTITSATPLVSYRVDYAPAGEIDLGDIAAPSTAYTTLKETDVPADTRELRSITAATFDPTVLLNDSYLIRVTATDINNRKRIEGVLVHVQGNLKFGEFRLEFTDLSVPLSGMPITIERIYDSRTANRLGDFGYGWSLGVRDARVLKTLKDGTMFLGSRVYLTTPDGRRVGFTTYVQQSASFGFTFVWVGLQPDPGVYEKLEFDGNLAIYYDGLFLGGLGDEPFNPSTYRLTTKDGAVYTYHDRDGLQNVVDPNGNRLVYTRNGIFHYPSGATNPDQSIPFTRDAAGRITRITDPDGQALMYTYNRAGDLELFTDQALNHTGYFYNAQRAHYLDRVIDPLGNDAIRTDYDDAGRVQSITDALGHVVSQEFDSDLLFGTLTDANGHVTKQFYDDHGNILKTVDALGAVTEFRFDGNNNEIWRKDARGFITQRGYDGLGNLTNITDATGGVTAIAYSDTSKPTSVTDALGRATQFRYNERGDLTNVVNALGAQAFFTRDTQGRVASVTDFNGHTTLYDYTGGCSCGKPGKITDPHGNFRLYEYNSRGQSLREINELGFETISSYDDVGRLISVRDAEGNTTRYAYAGALKVSESDPLGRTTYFAYDAANRLVAQTNAMGGVVRFEYDNGTNRTAVMDPVGNVTRFYYDAANRLQHQVDPWGRTNVFGYDLAGNRVEAVDRNGRKRTFAYDGLNRRTNELWWEGTSVVRAIDFSFNALGVMTGAADPASRLRFDFDALNRLERTTQSEVPGLPDFTLTNAYDGMTNVVSVTDNWGVEVASDYDARNRLEERTWQGGGLPGASLRFEHDAAGNRTNIHRYTDPAGTVLSGQSRYEFSPVGLIRGILHQSGAGATQAEYRYARNAAQEITQRVLGGQTVEYGYDVTGQLTNALYSAGQPDEAYHFDPNGNRIGGGYVVTTNNQIVADGTHTYEYDFEGSLVGRSNTLTHATTTYHYDHRNRLVNVLDSDASGTVTQTVDFTYDALNRRIAKSVNGAVTRFLLNQDNSWADTDAAGTITARYLLGSRIDEMTARYRPRDGVVWYLTDNLGTVRDLADSTGAVVNHVSYDSFGGILGQSGPALGDRFLFTGREWDGEVGLCFYRARYYSPELARFTSEDPLGLNPLDPDERGLLGPKSGGIAVGDINLYRFLLNNTITYTDPYGLAVAVEENKLNHIFANPMHQLAGLVAKAGGQVQAYLAVLQRIEAFVAAGGISGLFEETVVVLGYHITVRGIVINGVVRIGTFFSL
jgi:RHS repeat-associated protein